MPAWSGSVQGCNVMSDLQHLKPKLLGHVLAGFQGVPLAQRNCSLQGLVGSQQRGLGWT